MTTARLRNRRAAVSAHEIGRRVGRQIPGEKKRHPERQEAEER